jgi:hypothetical protein
MFARKARRRGEGEKSNDQHLGVVDLPSSAAPRLRVNTEAQHGSDAGPVGGPLATRYPIPNTSATTELSPTTRSRSGES